jgi:F-type H+-transporting ATPase subunit c
MDPESAKYIAKGMIILSMLATAIGEAFVAGKAFEAIGRNPKLEDTLFSKVIIAIALCESTAIYALVAFFTI